MAAAVRWGILWSGIRSMVAIASNAPIVTGFS